MKKHYVYRPELLYDLITTFTTFSFSTKRSTGGQIMQAWQSALLRATLETLVGQEATAAHSQEAPTIQAAQILRAAIPPSVLAALHVLAPKAANAAISDIDDAVQKTSLADLVDSSGASLSRPPILSCLTCGFAERETGHLLIKVKDHVVLIRDLRWTQTFQIHPTEQLDDLFCDCKAFEFGAELLCKHCVIALASLPLLEVKLVDEAKFLELLGEQLEPMAVESEVTPDENKT